MKFADFMVAGIKANRGQGARAFIIFIECLRQNITGHGNDHVGFAAFKD